MVKKLLVLGFIFSLMSTVDVDAAATGNPQGQKRGSAETSASKRARRRTTPLAEDGSGEESTAQRLLNLSHDTAEIKDVSAERNEFLERQARDLQVELAQNKQANQDLVAIIHANNLAEEMRQSQLRELQERTCQECAAHRARITQLEQQNVALLASEAQLTELNKQAYNVSERLAAIIVRDRASQDQLQIQLKTQQELINQTKATLGNSIQRLQTALAHATLEKEAAQSECLEQQRLNACQRLLILQLQEELATVESSKHSARRNAVTSSEYSTLWMENTKLKLVNQTLRQQVENLKQQQAREQAERELLVQTLDKDPLPIDA